MRLLELSSKQSILVLAPIIIFVSTYAAFVWLTDLLGHRAGYFTCQVFYWVTWCLIFSIYIIGKDDMVGLFKDRHPRFGRPSWLGMALLVAPVSLAFILGPFKHGLPYVTALMATLTLMFSIVNGVFEEILWRGTYIRLFSDSLFFGVLYPSIGFAIWHFSLLGTQPAAASDLIFIVGAGLAGVCWGYVAWQTGSIRWTILSHVLIDFSGLGALYFFS